jgi:hypothetical protein
VPALKYRQNATMGNDRHADVIEFPLDAKDDDPGSSGWDPYIFSIFSRWKKPYPEERRLKPRTLDAARRRALLLAKGRRRK